MTAPVSLSAVTLRRGTQIVLENISFELRPGEFVGLLGPNGAGKTTLLRALLGLVPAERGSIAVLGAQARAGLPGIGYLPQRSANPALETLSACAVLEAASWGPRPGLPRTTQAERARIARAVEWTGCARLLAKPVTALSGGERQRLLLAQALLDEPRLLLLDEPLVSLDPPSQAEIVGLVRRLQRALGFTVLFSSHELNPLLPALDRVLYLANRHAALGPVDEVITSPALSRLYGAPIEVLRHAGRVFVLQGGADPLPAAQPQPVLAGSH